METRRSFLVKILTALFLSSCGYGARGYGTALPQQNGGSCVGNGTTVSIELLHSPNHTLSVPKEDVVVGAEKIYILPDNGSGHIHNLTLTAGHFALLQAGQGIQVASTATDHAHLVSVNCI